MPKAPSLPTSKAVYIAKTKPEIVFNIGPTSRVWCGVRGEEGEQISLPCSFIFLTGICHGTQQAVVTANRA